MLRQCLWNLTIFLANGSDKCFSLSGIWFLQTKSQNLASKSIHIIWMQKFCKFVHLKLTFFILHSHFYKTPTSVCLLYTFIQIKYSKPSHYRPDQYPAIINPINTHGSIPIKTHSSKSSTVSPPNLTRLPHIKLSKNLKLLPLFLLSLLPDPHIMFLRAPPWHRF